MKVIAIHGKAESGKGTFLSKVFNHYKSYNPDAKVIEVNFADTLKDAVNLVFRIPKEYMYTTEGKETYLPQFKTTVRDILQRFGTEGCRSIYKDIWVWNLMEKIKVYEQENYDIVGISDLRFKNEYEALKKINALTVKTIRLNHKGINESQHLSERDLDDITDWDLICKAKNLNEVNIHALNFTNKFLI